MLSPKPRSKTVGVAVGTAALVATSTFDDHVGDALTQHELAEVRALVSAVQTRVAALGTPKTITPRQAWKLRSTLRFITTLQTRLAALPATDPVAVAALRSALATLQGTVQNVLASATVAPVAKASGTTRSFDPAKVDLNGSTTRHRCDHDGWRFGSGDFRHHDRDRYRWRLGQLEPLTRQSTLA
jgi:hypothetical protein